MNQFQMYYLNNAGQMSPRTGGENAFIIYVLATAWIYHKALNTIVKQSI